MDTGVRSERLNSLFYHFTGTITYDGLAKIFSETSQRQRHGERTRGPVEMLSFSPLTIQQEACMNCGCTGRWKQSMAPTHKPLNWQTCFVGASRVSRWGNMLYRDSQLNT